jgi:hypothetical protein
MTGHNFRTPRRLAFCVPGYHYRCFASRKVVVVLHLNGEMTGAVIVMTGYVDCTYAIFLTRAQAQRCQQYYLNQSTRASEMT